MSNQVVVTFLLSLILATILGAYKLLIDSRAKKKLERTAPMTGLQKSDRKVFQEAFRKICDEQQEIMEVIAMNGVEGKSDFILGIRTTENKRADHGRIITELHKYFFKKTKFIFINLDIPDSRNTFASGTIIVASSKVI